MRANGYYLPNFAEYRGSTMKKTSVFIVVMLLLGAFTAQAKTIAQEEREVIQAVNAYRAKKGLPAIGYDERIARVARVHSANMAAHRVPFGHTAFAQRMSSLYGLFKNADGGSENVAYFPKSKSPAQVVAMWLTSRGHRRNIEGNFQNSGVGIVHDSRGYVYYTHTFLHNKGAKAPRKIFRFW